MICSAVGRFFGIPASFQGGQLSHSRWIPGRGEGQDDLVQVVGVSGVSKSKVNRLCAQLDGRVDAFLSRPIEGE